MLIIWMIVIGGASMVKKLSKTALIQGIYLNSTPSSYHIKSNQINIMIHMQLTAKPLDLSASGSVVDSLAPRSKAKFKINIFYYSL
jgi:hypothetical protein